MTRNELILEYYEQESRRLLGLSKNTSIDKTEDRSKVEWRSCKERINILGQMLEELYIDTHMEGKEEPHAFTGEETSEIIGSYIDSTYTRPVKTDNEISDWIREAFE